ncbi:hypothetical protein B0H13DRAFT_1851481 [Mycena leptocephala]|nr:hypothetical protein B0H13DRAFT_1851481 [Mycena leptocephala]
MSCRAKHSGHRSQEHRRNKGYQQIHRPEEQERGKGGRTTEMAGPVYNGKHSHGVFSVGVLAGNCKAVTENHSRRITSIGVPKSLATERRQLVLEAEEAEDVPRHKKLAVMVGTTNYCVNVFPAKRAMSAELAAKVPSNSNAIEHQHRFFIMRGTTTTCNQGRKIYLHIRASLWICHRTSTFNEVHSAPSTADNSAALYPENLLRQNGALGADKSATKARQIPYIEVDLNNWLCNICDGIPLDVTPTWSNDLFPMTRFPTSTDQDCTYRYSGSGQQLRP